MLEPLGEHPQGKGLNLRDGVRLIGPVAHHASKVGDLGQPAPVLLSFELDLEGHERTVAPGSRAVTGLLRRSFAIRIQSFAL